MKNYMIVWEGFWTGTIALEAAATRLAFLAMMQSSDRNGEFHQSPGSLAVLAHISLVEAADAFVVLSSPDPSSKSEALEGRRIVEVGESRWQIVNYDKYRMEMQRVRDREKKRQWWADNRGKESRLDDTRRPSTELDTKGGGKEKGKGKDKTTLSVSRTKQTVYPLDFEEFWTIYPRPVGKKKALEAWIKTKPDRPANSDLLHALRNRISGWRNLGTEPDKIPHPTTWLNQHRWLDEPMRGDL